MQATALQQGWRAVVSGPAPSAGSVGSRRRSAYGTISAPWRLVRKAFVTAEHWLFASTPAGSRNPTVISTRSLCGPIVWACRAVVRKLRLPLRRTLMRMSSMPCALATRCLWSQNLKTRCLCMNFSAGTRAQRTSVPPSGRIWRKTSCFFGLTFDMPARARMERRRSRLVTPRARMRPRFRSMVKRWTWPEQQAVSSKSVSPLPSLSMQSPQISTAGAVQLSRGVCMQAPAVQRSCVQASWSSQSAVVRQGVQPGIGPLWQMPAPQNLVVQAFWSSQSPGVVQGLQPSTAVLWQTPASQDSVVQAFWSSQSAGAVQGLQPAMAVLWQTPASQESVVQAFWSSQSAAVVQGVQPATAVLWQTPASQDSVVQAFGSSQSPGVVQGLQPAIAVLWQTPPEQESVVQAFWSSQSAAVEQSVQPAMAVPAHCPLPSQASLEVQALPSSHGVLAGWKVSGGQ